MLQQRLSDFSRWVRQKIQQIEEDIDVCRVIYNLHGSLSQVNIFLDIILPIQLYNSENS